jgi:hypothetical protein
MDLDVKGKVNFPFVQFCELVSVRLIGRFERRWIVECDKFYSNKNDNRFSVRDLDHL